MVQQEQINHASGSQERTPIHQQSLPNSGETSVSATATDRVSQGEEAAANPASGKQADSTAEKLRAFLKQQQEYDTGTIRQRSSFTPGIEPQDATLLSSNSIHDRPGGRLELPGKSINTNAYKDVTSNYIHPGQVVSESQQSKVRLLGLASPARRFCLMT